MTLGTLIDLIREVEETERALEAAHQAVWYGGDDHTMKHKHDLVAYLTGRLAGLRNEEIPKED